MEELLKRLTDKDDKKAYELTKQLCAESAITDKYLGMIPVFVSMLHDKSSYVRTRGFILICNQARWADRSQISAVFDQMVVLLKDTKPTVVRQCLKALHEVILYRPELSKKIEEAVSEIELSKYKESMSHLIESDIEELKSLF